MRLPLLRPALAVLLAGGLIFAGCTGNDDDDSSPETTATVAGGNGGDPAEETPDGASPTADNDDETPTASEETATADDGGEALPEELEQILEDVAAIRGLDAPDNLQAEIITRSELPDVYFDLLTDEDYEFADDITLMYQLIGYLDNDTTYLDIYEEFISGAVLGFYVPDLDKLWVVTSDESGEIEWDSLSRGDVSTLAHELVHAVQDAAFDLAAVSDSFPDDPDHYISYSAIIEGDAVNHEELYAQEYLTLPGVVPILLPGGATQQLGIPDPILREEFFPYTTGPAFVAEILATEGVERINELLTDPPGATSYILHPELLDSGWEPETVTLPDLAAALGEGWEEAYAGTFGEFQWDNYLRQQLGGRTAIDASEGWQGDWFSVLSDGDESVAAFRIAFADEDEAGEFLAAHDDFVAGELAFESSHGPLTDFGFATFDDGDTVGFGELGERDVLVVYGSTPELVENALLALVGG